MATASEDRLQAWSANTVIELREKSLALALFDSSWESEYMNGAESVTITKPVWAPSGSDGVQVNARNRGANWGGRRGHAQDVVKLARIGGYDVSNVILWEDAVELPWPVVERTRSRQVYEAAHYVDTAVFDNALAGASQTISIGAADTYRVQKTFPYAADIPAGSDHPVYAAIQSFSLAMYRANAISGEGSPTGAAGTPFMILQPELIASLRSWLLNKGLSFDALTAEILRENPGMAEALGYVGNLSGVRLYAWNHLAIATGVNWPNGYAGITQAYAVGQREPLVQYFTPQENQTSEPGHLLRQLGEFAGVEVEDAWHRKIQIRAGS